MHPIKCWYCWWPWVPSNHPKTSNFLHLCCISYLHDGWK